MHFMLFHRLEEKCFANLKALNIVTVMYFPAFFYYYLSSLGNNYVLNRENNAFSLCVQGEGQQNALVTILK